MKSWPMKSWPTILLACLLCAGIGFLAGRASLRQAPSRQAALLPPPPHHQGAISLAAAPAAPPVAAAKGPAAGTHALNLLRVALNTRGDHAEACLVFSAKLSQAADFHPGDFLRIEPAIKAALRNDGPQLCLAGLDFATAYKVTTLAGLPAADGSRLLADETLPLSLGDLPATADFADDGFILARGSAQGLPIATVNTGSVHLRVDRITDRVLVRTELGRGYRDNEGDDDTLGVRLWEGDLSVAPGRNEKKMTAFPLNQVLDHRLPGAYRMTLVSKPSANRGGDYVENKYRWVFNTDLMLTSHRGADGLHVFMRSLATARPLRGVQVVLLAANNDELGRAETDADGQGIFPAALLRGGQGLVPHMVMAYLGDDFTALELNRPGFDLSDRGVDGRPDPGEVDGYLYTDRGIYRPGETIQLGTILRNHLALPLPAGQAVWITLRRPDGVEAGKYRLEPNAIGVAVTGIVLKTTAPRGTWKLEESLAGATAKIGGLDVQVQDFVPNRLAVDLAPRGGPGGGRITQDAPAVIDVASRYLYGAPAADLDVSAHVELQRDTQPVAEHGWQFGRAGESLNAQAQDIEAAKTDAQGHATVSIDAAALKIPQTSLPLRAEITVSVAEPGGRATEAHTSLPITTHGVLLGLRAPNEAGALMEDTASAMSVAAFAPGGQRVAGKIDFRLSEQVTKYDYYYEDGHWQWKSATHDRPVTFGTLDVPASGASLNLPPLPWGTYRVEVSEAGGAFTSLVLHSGYSPDPDQADSPEKVAVSLVGPPPRAGGTARLHIKPPFGGQVLVTVENDRVLEAQTAVISADGADVSVVATSDWGVGAYVMASVYRPAGEAAGHAPVRAVGLAYVKLDVTDRTLGVALAAPPVLRPRTHLDLGVTVSGEAAKQGPVWMTLAAVDEGILDLTRFASPDPAAHFFGKRRLAVDLRDDYAHLIDGNGAAFGAIRAGGDLDGAGLTVVPTRTTALFSGLVQVGADGHATVPLDLPDFTGGLRLMAVAVSATGFGHAESQVPVRDPVVAQMSLPRFLAPGDAGLVTLLAHNVEAPSGTYHIHLAGEGALGMAPIDDDIAFAARQALVKTYKVIGGNIGTGRLILTLSGPGGMHIVHDWPIEIRTPFQSVTRVSRADQAPGEAVVLSPALARGLVAKGASIRASFSAIGGIDLPGLLAALDEYPFGCSEQLVSRAMPLLYVEQEAKLAGVAQPDLHFRIQDAVDKLLERQNEAGAFGLWRAGDGQAEPYLGAEITDFLARAQAHGYAVPAHALSQAAKALSDMQDYQVRRFWYWEEGRKEETEAEDYVRRAGRAYGMLLAARAGQADIADLRYMHDTDLDKMEPLSQAQLAVGLGLLGDKPRADHAFDAAEAALAQERDELAFRLGDYYRTRLRDTAAMVALAAEMGDRPRTQRLIEALSRQDMRTERLSTQEQGWLVIAAGVLLERAGPVRVSLDGAAQPPASVVTVRLEVEGLKPVRARNDGSGPFTRMLAVRGLPLVAPPAASNGISMTKTVTASDGGRVDLAHLRQGQRLVVHLSGRAFDTAYHQAIVLDPLPAGFEIERVVAPSTDAEANGLPWLGEITPTRGAEKRDDRFIAAIDLNRAPEARESENEDADPNAKKPPAPPPPNVFNLAYVVRVVSPGRFVLPAGSVADMYRPDVQARGAVGQVGVDAGQ